MNWLKSTFCIVRLNADSGAKLTDGGNPFHALIMRSAKNFLRVLLTLCDFNKRQTARIGH